MPDRGPVRGFSSDFGNDRVLWSVASAQQEARLNQISPPKAMPMPPSPSLPQPPALFTERELKLNYWNADPRLLDAERMDLERHLQRLGDVKVASITSLAEVTASCDLLIVAAQKIPAADFAAWLAAFKGRIRAQGSIWTPVLILADVAFEDLSDIWQVAAKDNWYFDILAPAHMASLPIRVANLVRIHDHLHELKRYAAAVDDVSTKVVLLESQIRDLGSSRRTP